MQCSKRQLNPRRNVQLLICTISKTSCTLVIMTRSIGRTLLMIIWLKIFGVHFRLTWVSMQGIRQRLILLMKIHHLRGRVWRIGKKKTASFLNNSSQSCASSKADIFMETFGPSEINPEKANSLKTKVSFQVSNDSLAYFLSFYWFPRIILMLQINQRFQDTQNSVISYTRHNLTIINQEMMYCYLNPVLHTWEIWRLCSPISFDIKTHLMSFTSYIGEKICQMYWPWRSNTTEILISSLSIISKDQVKTEIG